MSGDAVDSSGWKEWVPVAGVAFGAVSSETRQAFARDLLNLTLVDPGTNRDRKSAKDAADWLPELNRCWFANRVVAVRQKYGLTVDAQERDALEAVLSDCESADLLIYAPQAGPLSGIYTVPGGSEALLIVQDHFGETVTITLRFEAGPDGQITPATWIADFSRFCPIRWPRGRRNCWVGRYIH